MSEHSRSPVYLELLDLAHNNGHLTADAVVEAASDPSSPLHNAFIWDDEVAGHQYRLHQARMLIGRYKITLVETPDIVVSVRAFTSMPTDDGNRGWQPTEEIFATTEGRRIALEQAAREVNNLRKKYQNLVDFDAVLRQQIRNRDDLAS